MCESSAKTRHNTMRNTIFSGSEGLGAMKKLIIIIISFLVLCGLLPFRQLVVINPPPKSEGSLGLQIAEEIPHTRVDIISTDPMSDTAEDQSFYTEPQEELTITEPVKNDSLAVFKENNSGNDENSKLGYTIIHHDAEYKTIHHDAVMIHHEAEYKTIHHEAEGHYEETVVTPSWDETVEKEKIVQHVFCNEGSCHMDFTAAGLSSSQIWDHLEAHALKGEASGHHTEDIRIIVTETIHHDAVTERVWVTDKDVWDEKVLIKEAWDEVRPAYDERILVKEAWDEKVPG